MDSTNKQFIDQMMSKASKEMDLDGPLSDAEMWASQAEEALGGGGLDAKSREDLEDLVAKNNAVQKAYSEGYEYLSGEGPEASPEELGQAWAKQVEKLRSQIDEIEQIYDQYSDLLANQEQ